MSFFLSFMSCLDLAMLFEWLVRLFFYCLLGGVDWMVVWWLFSNQLLGLDYLADWLVGLWMAG